MADAAQSSKERVRKFVIFFTFFLIIFTAAVQIFLVQREIGLFCKEVILVLNIRWIENLYMMLL